MDNTPRKITVPTKIVHKITDDIDPAEVLCTTYQMRNFFKQMGDGFFSSLDVMNYIQHHAAVLKMRKGYRVLDVCCGRGLLLPLIRWHRKEIAEYVGVDISESNMAEQSRWSASKRIDGLDYYPFPVTQHICNVAEMGPLFTQSSFDVVVYTSAIEHMQKDAGYQSLKSIYSVIKDSGLLFLSCPNTTEKKDPYDTQYAAHLYEWDLEELRAALSEIGFYILDEFGLVAKKLQFDKFMENQPAHERDIYERFKAYLPTNWLMSLMPILYPEAASEVLILASPTPGNPDDKINPKGFNSLLDWE